MVRTFVAVLLAFGPFGVQAQPTEAPTTSRLTPPPGGWGLVNQRVFSIGYRLAVRGAAYCSEQYPLTGLGLFHLAQFGEAERRIYIDKFALDRGPAILVIVADSPAARSGLLPGDILLAVNGRPFPRPEPLSGNRRKYWPQSVRPAEEMLERELAKGPVQLRIGRNGDEFDRTLGSVPGCPLRIRLSDTQERAQMLDGYVLLSPKLLDFVQSDDELAIIIGHELAHAILGHQRGRGFRVYRAEVEAEKLGLRIARAAGYDLRAAIPMYRRFYPKHDAFMFLRTHPSLKARERLIEEAIAEIERDAG